MIIHVMKIIESFKERQKKRILSHTRSTQGNDHDTFNEPLIMNKFVVAMDNYFTLPNVMNKLRDMGIGVVGTAQFKKNWPPKKLKELTSNDVNFNQFHYCVDQHSTLLGRWVDNTLVFCVSTVHRVSHVIKRLRRRPRETMLNKRHVRSVWGGLGRVFITYLN